MIIKIEVPFPETLEELKKIVDKVYSKLKDEAPKVSVSYDEEVEFLIFSYESEE